LFNPLEGTSKKSFLLKEYVGFFHLETKQNRRKRGEPRIGRKEKKNKGKEETEHSKDINKQESW
jgi:hypothetical protein